ncbi:MAG: beta-N-acetylhexosaminidase [Puniceicoccales bacterium]|jgi:hypothetical protein|nr:beta-N-acetylhexosaminidase [Puniceicoccales bacterium]
MLFPRFFGAVALMAATVVGGASVDANAAANAGTNAPVAAAAVLPAHFQLLPVPQKVELLGGAALDVSGSDAFGLVIAVDAAKVPPLPTVLDGLRRTTATVHPPSLKKVSFNARPSIALHLATEGVPASPEGYVLEITSTDVVITARAQAGLFYGLQTLAQLIEDARETAQDGPINAKTKVPFPAQIPAVKITDFPAVGYRAIHIDLKHHLDTTAYYYKLIDNLARYKINGIIWEIEDKLRYERRPEVAAPQALSKQELRAISRYAKERNIEISPLVQGIGHAAFILKHHKDLRENPKSDWTFCPTNPKTYEMQFDLYRDALEAFPDGKFLHVGGDEVGGLGSCPRCRQTKKSAFELQMFWLKKVCDFAETVGRAPIFWDDMPLKHAGAYDFIYHMKQSEVEKKWNTKKLDRSIELFPKNCVYMRWNYDASATNIGHKKVLNWYKEKGLRVMAATSASTNADIYLPRENSRAKYIRDFTQLVAENNLVGILTTNWEDSSAHTPTVERGFAAQGEYGWNPTARSIEQFKTAHARREWSLSRPEVNFIDNLEQAADFVETAFVKRRSTGWTPPSWRPLIALPDPKKPGEWNKVFQSKLKRAHEFDALIKKSAADIRWAYAMARRNRYTLEVYDALNNFFAFAPRLLLALEKYDAAAADSAEKRTALKAVLAECDTFAAIREKVETIYSKTRFMSNPPSYKLDQNNHSHLAATTNNSDWFFRAEIAYLAKIRDWAKRQ